MSRLIKTPKLHLTDTGLAAALLGVDAASLTRDRTLLGQLLETFVFQELRRQASWCEKPITFHHFRHKDGAEVDIVLDHGAGEVAGIEVKAAATVTATDFRGLKKLREATGDRFRQRRGPLRRRERGRFWRQPVRGSYPCTLGDHLTVELRLPALSPA